MELEKVIKQKAFQSQTHKLLINLIYTGNWLQLNVSKQLKQYELTSQQYNILRILRGQHPQNATISLIAERMLDKSSNVTRIVDKLVAKKLVSRAKDPKDNRKVWIKITYKGLDLLQVIDAKMPPPQEVLNGLSEEEAKIINDFLDNLRGNEEETCDEMPSID
jgi:DNA-binding MarR family transcriptional regulator